MLKFSRTLTVLTRSGVDSTPIKIMWRVIGLFKIIK